MTRFNGTFPSIQPLPSMKTFNSILFVTILTLSTAVVSPAAEAAILPRALCLSLARAAAEVQPPSTSSVPIGARLWKNGSAATVVYAGTEVGNLSTPMGTIASKPTKKILGFVVPACLRSMTDTMVPEKVGHLAVQMSKVRIFGVVEGLRRSAQSIESVPVHMRVATESSQPIAAGAQAVLGAGGTALNSTDVAHR